jgi:hypothetical protein
MNSQVTSVRARGLYRSAISISLIHLREIDRTAFWEFCNTIPSTADIRGSCEQVRLVTKPDHGSLNYIVRERKQQGWHDDTEPLGCLEIDDERELSRLLDR